MKKFLAILLTLIMVLPVFSVMVIAEAAPDQNAEPGSEAYTAWLKSEGYTAISSYAELKAITDKTATGKYYFTNDITADGQIVYTFGDGVDFAGTIDGNGYTIYNMAYAFCGDWSGTLRNVTFSKYVAADSTTAIVRKDNGIKWRGVITYSMNGGAVIENVVNNVEFGDVANAIGAFAGELYKPGKITFKNCVNNGSIISRYGSNNHKIGGFIGTVTADDAGYDVEFINCANNGDITASQAGGFVGSMPTKGVTMTFTNCINTGTITGTAGGSAHGKAGGFLGNTNNGESGTTYNLTFENCTNTGDILRHDGASNDKQAAQGGFMGWIKATTLNLTMTNCVVKDCRIDGTGTNNTSSGKGEASGLIGRLIPNSANGTIDINNCTVENVVIEAYNAGRKFAFLCGTSSHPVTLVNCYANNVTYSDGKAAKLFEEVTVEDVKVMVVKLAYNITEESSVVSINKAQQSVANAEGKTAVRFIGTVNGLGFAEIGYYVELNGKAIKLTTDTVYNSLNNNYGENQITAESLNAAFLTAVVMNDVTADFNGTIKVTPFVKNLDGTYTYGKTKAISFTNGAIGECL